MPGQQRADLAALREGIRAAATYRPDADRPPPFAIDFVAVDAERRTATGRDWRTVLSVEPLDRFLGFGEPILAPADGRVVAAMMGRQITLPDVRP